MKRAFATTFFGAIVASGCLFPSFDDMQRGQRKGAIAPRAEDDVTSGTSTSTGMTPTDPAVDASVETGATAQTAGVIACDGEAGICAADGQSFCCATVGGPSCQGPGTEGFCTGVEGGKILRCDGSDDCPGSANICCFLAGAKEAACATSCAGAILCSKEEPKCPAGKSCTGVITHGGGFQSSFCQ